MPDRASIVVCLPEGHSFTDPNPADTERRQLRISSEWDETTVGILGWSAGGSRALDVAARHPDVPRLVLVSVPFAPESPTPDLAVIAAKTLLLFGSADPATGSKHGRSWQQNLTNARLEMVPGGGHDLLEQMWPRILSHLAPGRRS